MAKKGCVISWSNPQAITITGVVDEYADFSGLASMAQKTLAVDLGGVTRVNSSGIRNWIQTILRNKIQIVLSNCSPVIVDQFSMIPEFIGKSGYVESFYGNFHCASCGYEHAHLFVLGRDVQAGHVRPLIALTQPCPRCPETMDFDHNPDVYFAFLKMVKPRQQDS